MKRPTLFKQFILLVSMACLLTASLSAIIFTAFAIRPFASSVTRDMEPWAMHVSRMTTDYFDGKLSFDSYVDISIHEKHGYSTYIFDGNGNIILYDQDEDAAEEIDFLKPYAQKMLLNGEKMISQKWNSKTGFFVGVPIKMDPGVINGAVFVAKPTREVGNAFRSSLTTLLLSFAASLAVLTIPAYFVSRHLSKPIRVLSETAADMANGNYKQTIPDGKTEELHELGGTISKLSQHLDETICQLREKNEQLNIILSGLCEGVIAADRDNTVVYYNPEAMKLLGLSNQNDLDLWIKEHIVSLEANLEKAEPRVIKIGEAVLQVDTAFHGDEGEKDKHAVIIIRDISEYERLEQTRRDYVANVSHELRTPIASIRGLAEALNDGIVRDEETKNRYYGYILRESARLSRLINDLLKLSRLQSGTEQIKRENFNLEDLIEDVVGRMHFIADESGIDIAYERSSETQICSNRDMLEQVLVALIDNGIKYAPDDSTLEVEVCKKTGTTVRIINRGELAQKDISHIFERFYKADRSHSETGTGLGLAITRELLIALGQTIKAYNENGNIIFEFTIS